MAYRGQPQYIDPRMALIAQQMQRQQAQQVQPRYEMGGGYVQPPQPQPQQQSAGYGDILEMVGQLAAGETGGGGKSPTSGGVAEILQNVLGGGGGAAGGGAAEVSGVGPVSSGAEYAGMLEPGMFDLAGIGSQGNLLLPAAGAYGFHDLYSGHLDKNRGGWGRGIGQGAASGAAIGSYFGLPGAAIGAGVGGLLGAGKVALGHKSTKDYQNQRWGALDPSIQHFKDVAHSPNDTGVWQEGKYAGEKWSFDKALDRAREKPSEFIGMLGNFEAFGPDWVHLPQAQQEQVVKALIDSGQYKSDKGDVIVKDKDKARQIMQETLANPQAGKPEASAAAVAQRFGIDQKDMYQPIALPPSAQAAAQQMQQQAGWRGPNMRINPIGSADQARSLLIGLGLNPGEHVQYGPTMEMRIRPQALAIQQEVEQPTQQQAAQSPQLSDDGRAKLEQILATLK